MFSLYALPGFPNDNIPQQIMVTPEGQAFFKRARYAGSSGIDGKPVGMGQGLIGIVFLGNKGNTLYIDLLPAFHRFDKNRPRTDLNNTEYKREEFAFTSGGGGRNHEQFLLIIKKRIEIARKTHDLVALQMYDGLYSIDENFNIEIDKKKLFGIGVYKGSELHLLYQVRAVSTNLNNISVKYNREFILTFFHSEESDEPIFTLSYAIMRLLPPKISTAIEDALVNQLETTLPETKRNCIEPNIPITKSLNKYFDQWQKIKDIPEIKIDGLLGTMLRFIDDKINRYNLVVEVLEQIKTNIKLIAPDEKEQGMLLNKYLSQDASQIILKNIKMLPAEMAKLSTPFEKYKTENKTLIMYVIEKFHNNLLRLLLKNNVDISSKNSSRYSAIQHAIQCNNEDAVTLLIDSGAIKNFKEREGSLKLAVQKCHVLIVEALLRSGANFKEMDWNSIIDSAISNKRMHVIIILIKYGFDAIKIDAVGINSKLSLKQFLSNHIFDYSKNNGIKEIKKLSSILPGDLFREICALKDVWGNTPLLWAAYKGHADVVRWLQTKGIDDTVKNNEGQGLVENFSMWVDAGVRAEDYTKIGPVLREFKTIDLKFIGKESKQSTAEFISNICIQSAKDNNIKKLEQIFASLPSDRFKEICALKDVWGNTPLLWAAYKGHADVVRWLQTKGIDDTVKNNEGQGLVENFSMWVDVGVRAEDYTKIGPVLREFKTIDLKFIGKESKQSIAEFISNICIQSAKDNNIKKLEQIFASLPSDRFKEICALKDVWGNTPLLWAACRGHTDAVRWLQAKGADNVDRSSLPKIPSDVYIESHIKKLLIDIDTKKQNNNESKNILLTKEIKVLLMCLKAFMVHMYKSTDTSKNESLLDLIRTLNLIYKSIHNKNIFFKSPPQKVLLNMIKDIDMLILNQGQAPNKNLNNGAG